MESEGGCALWTCDGDIGTFGSSVFGVGSCGALAVYWCVLGIDGIKLPRRLLEYMAQEGKDGREKKEADNGAEEASSSQARAP